MTVVFCLDDNPRYLMLFRIAVRSLKALHGNARCVCVYAGNNEAVLRGVLEEGVELARYQPTLTPEIIPEGFHCCIGAFLKLELALVPELANEEKILYCDCDVLFQRSLDELWCIEPAYMAMAREATAPFFHTVEKMTYVWRSNEYTVPMPFPIWTFSSGVVLFNLQRLRRLDYIHNFLAFCAQNVHHIGNLDQSLLNYFFGKRVTKLEQCWNLPPYRPTCLSEGHIVHFHGPKPWETTCDFWKDLRINCFWQAREIWRSFLTDTECRVVDGWVS